jgi:sugar lactone lactonase YvrE
MSPLSPDDLNFLASGLNRPECVLTHASGLKIAADWTGQGGVALIVPDGAVHRLEAKGLTEPLRPNGIALEAGGTILAAHLGPDTGGLFRLFPDGAVEPVLTHLDGRALPPSNFPCLDREGRIWLTISTRVTPRADDYRPHAASGFIVLIDRGSARIVADGLGYTNECAISADGRFLYVNETFARRLTRFAIEANGDLGEPRVIATFGPGTFPDGLTLDEAGGLWVTSIVSNRVIRIDPEGAQDILLEDCDPAHLADVEAAFTENRMGRPHLDRAGGEVLRNISSLAFGDADLRTAYLGCLLGEQIATFSAPFAGLRPIHFDYPLGALGEIAGLPA